MLSQVLGQMRVLHVLPYYFSVEPGAYTSSVVTQTTALALQQEASGHRVFVFGGKGLSALGDACLETSITNIRVDDRSVKLQRAYLAEAGEVAKDLQADVIHNHISKLTFVWPELNVSVPTINTIHAPPDEYQRKIFLDRTGSGPSNVIWLSHRQKALWGAHGCDPVIHHGVDINRYTLPDDQPTRNGLLVLGRITPNKGTHLAVQAAKLLGRKLTIAGPVEDAVYFRRYVEPLLDNEIRFVGAVAHKESIKTFQSHEVLLNPIQWEEAFGLTMVEAPLCGCPVVSFSVGAARELIRVGRNGYLVEAGDMERLVSAVAEAMLLDHQEVRAASVLFTIERSAERYIEEYAWRCLRADSDQQR